MIIPVYSTDSFSETNVATHEYYMYGQTRGSGGSPKNTFPHQKWKNGIKMKRIKLGKVENMLKTYAIVVLL